MYRRRFWCLFLIFWGRQLQQPPINLLWIPVLISGERGRLLMTAEAIKVIWASVSTHHQGLVRIILLYWFWSCLAHGRQPGSVSFNRREEEGDSSLMAREVKAEGLSVWISRPDGNICDGKWMRHVFRCFSIIFAYVYYVPEKCCKSAQLRPGRTCSACYHLEPGLRKGNNLR